MGRALRAAQGGYVYHVLNRANARSKIFGKPADFEAFERILTEARKRYDMRICAYCVLSNHWHLVLWPREDGGLSKFMGCSRSPTPSVDKEKVSGTVLWTKKRCQDKEKVSGTVL